MNGWARLAAQLEPALTAANGSPSRTPSPGPPSQVREGLATLSDGVLIPNRTSTVVTPRVAVGLPAVYAAVRLITHTIDQLPLVAEVGDTPVDVPAWLRHPDRYGCDYSLPDLIEYLVTSQATRGAAYLYCTPTGDMSWRLDAIDPDEVSVQLGKASGRPVRTFRIAGDDTPQVRVYPFQQRTPGILPMPFLVMPGLAAGVGPLQAAKDALGGFVDVDRYAASQFGAGRVYSGGYLTTEQFIDETEAQHYSDKLAERNAQVNAKPLVLGQGLDWKSSLLDPKTAQWIEARQFNSQEVCRMYGIPPRYLGLPSGDSTTYSTARDNDAQLLRTCVSGYTNTIAHALSRLLPAGRTPAEDQRVRFDFDAWLGSPAAAPPPASTPPGQEVPA